VYRAHGITIPRDADAQFASGRPVSLERMLPGDLLFYEHPVVGHVAMYIGDGRMIESPNSASEVRIVPVRTSDFRGVRRFLGR
jgi:cell wall-associated NlpC family hydrolase